MQMVEKRGGEYLSKNLPLLREDLRTISKTEAANRFIRQVATLPVEHSTHLYKLKRAKDEPLGSAWLGICPRGIQIYEVSSAVAAVPPRVTARPCDPAFHRVTHNDDAIQRDRLSLTLASPAATMRVDLLALCPCAISGLSACSRVCSMLNALRLAPGTTLLQFSDEGPLLTSEQSNHLCLFIRSSTFRTMIKDLRISFPPSFGQASANCTSRYLPLFASKSC